MLSAFKLIISCFFRHVLKQVYVIPSVIYPRPTGFEQLQNTISNKNINWINIWDEDDTITHLFGVAAIPTTILINKEGLIVYRCTGLTDENEKEIADLLEKDL